jgi:hypothetical protein
LKKLLCQCGGTYSELEGEGTRAMSALMFQREVEHSAQEDSCEYHDVLEPETKHGISTAMNRLVDDQ